MCFSVHGILQARILEWLAMPSSRIEPAYPALAGGFLTLSHLENPGGLCSWKDWRVSLSLPLRLHFQVWGRVMNKTLTGLGSRA